MSGEETNLMQGQTDAKKVYRGGGGGVIRLKEGDLGEIVHAEAGGQVRVMHVSVNA